MSFRNQMNPPQPVQLQRIRLCLAVTAYRKWDFRATDVSRGILRSEPLKRDTYVQLPKWADGDNVAWGLLKPLYGLSTACKDWYETIRNSLLGECGGNVTSLGGLVFFWTQQVSTYGYGKEFRGKIH